MNTNGCELVRNSRELAKDKGLPPGDVMCFYSQLGLCLETACAMIHTENNPNWGKMQLARFYDRLVKHAQKVNR